MEQKNIYISTKELSQKWGVSQRTIQSYCKNGKIQGAIRCKNLWRIPINVEKSSDLRNSENIHIKSNKDYYYYLMLTSTFPMSKKHPYAILDRLDDAKKKSQYESELFYMKGDFEAAKSCFKNTSIDEPIKLCSCTIALAASIATADFVLYEEIITFLKTTIESYKGTIIEKISEGVLSMAYVSAVAPELVPNWLKVGDLYWTTTENKLYTLYLYIKYLESTKKYEAMLSATVTTLALCNKKGTFSILEIYLYILRANAHVKLNQRELACKYLKIALDMAIPDGFIIPFSENLVALGGIGEKLILKYYPDYYDVILDNYHMCWKNWILFHNRFTNDNITTILSKREYRIALYLSSGASYDEIAKIMNLSKGRIRNIISEIYSKLLINSKKELVQFIL